MPKTKCLPSKKKMTGVSLPPELPDIAENKDRQSEMLTCLEQFELDFSFRMQKFDELLQEKIAALVREKEKMKIKYSNCLGTIIGTEEMFAHELENVSTNGEQTSSWRENVQANSAVYSSQVKNDRQIIRIPKHPIKKEAVVPYSGFVYQTPAITSSIPKLPIVTPKVPVNAPFSVMRVPRQGEVALSLSGSPVMVSTMSHETKANINIPLSGGMIVSLLPDAGLDPTCLPVIDEEMMEQLETLNEHICTFINKATKK